MGTLQGEMLTRIARAHQRAVTAEYALQEAKAALKRTREANDLALAQAEVKAAALELGAALDETTQLPLPGTGNSPGEIDAAIERATGAAQRAARVGAGGASGHASGRSIRSAAHGGNSLTGR